MSENLDRLDSEFKIHHQANIVFVAVEQNAEDFAFEYPRAAKAVHNSFYVDDGLTGADSVTEPIEPQGELQELSRHGYLQKRHDSGS